MMTESDDTKTASGGVGGEVSKRMPVECSSYSPSPFIVFSVPQPNGSIDSTHLDTRTLCSCNDPQLPAPNSRLWTPESHASAPRRRSNAARIPQQYGDAANWTQSRADETGQHVWRMHGYGRMENGITRLRGGGYGSGYGSDCRSGYSSGYSSTGSQPGRKRKCGLDGERTAKNWKGREGKREREEGRDPARSTRVEIVANAADRTDSEVCRFAGLCVGGWVVAFTPVYWFIFGQVYFQNPEPRTVRRGLPFCVRARA